MLKKISISAFPIILLLQGTLLAEGEATPPPASGFFSIVPILLLFVIFYLLLIRPQQKKAKEHKEMVSKLQKGDNVITSSGIFGRITGVAEDCFTVEIADNVRIKVSKEHIASKKH